MRFNFPMFASAIVLAAALGACTQATREAVQVQDDPNGRTSCGELATDGENCRAAKPALVNEARVGRTSCGELAADGANCAGVEKAKVAAATPTQ
jgi:hypothetical protein